MSGVFGLGSGNHQPKANIVLAMRCIAAVAQRRAGEVRNITVTAAPEPAAVTIAVEQCAAVREGAPD